MLRSLFGGSISQKSKSEFYSSTDLVRAGNKWRSQNGMSPFNFSLFMNKKSTKEFIDELQKKYGECVIKGRGRAAHTWVHPLLFIEIALAISPKLKIEVYEWLFDSLIKFRNDSGDSYKEMSASLYKRHGNHKQFPFFISKIADKIRLSCGVTDWQTATEEQLKLRDDIHRSIKTLSNVLTDPNEIVRLSIIEHTKG